MNDFDEYLNKILPLADAPVYIKELLSQAERPITAGVGAERQQLSAETTRKIQSTLASMKPKGRALVQREVERHMKRAPAPKAVVPLSERTKVVEKKKFNHLDAMK